jgi:hypothetical protein
LHPGAHDGAAKISGGCAPLGFARGSQDSAAPGGREYYELRRYHLLTPQRTGIDDYFQNALVPGLNRQGISTVGVFNVLIPSASYTFENLVTHVDNTVLTPAAYSQIWRCAVTLR